ncbi:uncharacterized protein LOC108958563 [Eucalyptus grandis]|uniref:uncharacterized protein LOC108958563 n=1 Tax=Eucalyptus grandis TaxID=71139 RepID=UPI0008A0B1B6|nr:uncharacterized protein LOC108958563 [Eucalyptus grandis]
MQNFVLGCSLAVFFRLADPAEFVGNRRGVRVFDNCISRSTRYPLPIDPANFLQPLCAVLSCCCPYLLPNTCPISLTSSSFQSQLPVSWRSRKADVAAETKPWMAPSSPQSRPELLQCRAIHRALASLLQPQRPSETELLSPTRAAPVQPAKSHPQSS